jgi:curved DNA-binding protein CbpA
MVFGCNSAVRHEAGLVDHYATLGLTQRSNLTEVKARFRELARQSHPDKTAAGGAAAQGVGVVPAGHTPPPDFVQVREAYDGILAVLEPHPDHKEL